MLQLQTQPFWYLFEHVFTLHKFDSAGISNENIYSCILLFVEDGCVFYNRLCTLILNFNRLWRSSHSKYPYFYLLIFWLSETALWLRSSFLCIFFFLQLSSSRGRKPTIKSSNKSINLRRWSSDSQALFDFGKTVLASGLTPDYRWLRFEFFFIRFILPTSPDRLYWHPRRDFPLEYRLYTGSKFRKWVRVQQVLNPLISHRGNRVRFRVGRENKFEPGKPPPKWLEVLDTKGAVSGGTPAGVRRPEGGCLFNE